MSVKETTVAAVKWPVVQTKGAARNAWRVATKYSATDFVPPWITETWDWLKAQVPRAFGLGTPGQQMASSVVLIIASIATSLFTGFATLFFVAVFTLTFLGGLLRLVPIVDELWPFGQSE